MTRRDRLMILTVLGVALLGGFWMLILSPQRQAAAAAKSQLETARNALAGAQAKVTTGKAAQEAFRRDRATIVKIGRVVPETDDIPTLITQLETLAKRNDVYFIRYAIGDKTSGGGASSSASSTTSTPQSVQKGSDSSTNAVAPLYPPGSVEVTGGLGRTPITIGLRGTYFKLERYLRAVQRFAVLSGSTERTKGRLVVVDGFSYEPTDLVFKYRGGKTKSTERWLEAKLGASVYFAPPLATPPSSTAVTPGAAPGAGTPASSATPPTTTGAAAVGGLR